MAQKKRTTVIMNAVMAAKVAVLMRHGGFTNFTFFQELLVHEEWDRRSTPELEAALKTELAKKPDAAKAEPEKPKRKPSK